MDKEKMKKACWTHNNIDYQDLLDKPKEVYHYTSMDTLQKILEKKQLRFTNREYLNDESEGTYVLKLCKERIDDLWSNENSEEKKAFCKYLDEVLAGDHRDVFQIYQVSFSCKADSLTMWNYYAGENGCCIQFYDEVLSNFRNKLKEPKPDSLLFLYGKVIYNKNKQVKILKKIFEKYTFDCDDAYGMYCFVKSILRIGAFFKHPGFKDERECRIVFELAKDEKNEFNMLIPQKKAEPPETEDTLYKCSVYSKHGMLVPHVDIDFDLKWIKSITVPPIAKFETVEEGIKIWLREKKLKNVPIKKSEIPLRF